MAGDSGADAYGTSGTIRDLNRAVVLNLVRERACRAPTSRGVGPESLDGHGHHGRPDRRMACSSEDDAGRRRPDTRGTGTHRPPRDTAASRSSARGMPWASSSARTHSSRPSRTSTPTPRPCDACPTARARTLRARSRCSGHSWTTWSPMAGIDPATLVGLGIGVPGVVDPASGTVTGSPLPDWVEHDLPGPARGVTSGFLCRRQRRQHADDRGAPVRRRTRASTRPGRGDGRPGHRHGRRSRTAASSGAGAGARRDRPRDRGAARAARAGAGAQGCLEALAAEPALVREVLAVTGRLVTPDDLAGLAEQDPRVAVASSSAPDALVGDAIAHRRPDARSTARRRLR